MKRLTTAIVIAIAFSLPAQAEVYDPFVLQLHNQGYSDITVGRTWLGRIVINAQRADITREIVLNARTGEILGDHASDINLQIAPQYSSNDRDSDSRPPAAPIVPSDDTATATVTFTDEGDVRTILDTGVATVVDD